MYQKMSAISAQVAKNKKNLTDIYVEIEARIF